MDVARLDTELGYLACWLAVKLFGCYADRRQVVQYDRHCAISLWGVVWCIANVDVTALHACCSMLRKKNAYTAEAWISELMTTAAKCEF